MCVSHTKLNRRKEEEEEEVAEKMSLVDRQQVIETEFSGPFGATTAHEASSASVNPPSSAVSGKPRLRYFSVGPSSYQVRCPLCSRRADTETVQMAGALGSLSCALSLLSCCFPVFSLALVYCCLQRRLKSERVFCNECGGYLGFYRRPT